ncbi:MAG: hypothetical protein INQ03_16440 [Candidatus Heimdallarchaeota archaeon]|nr:hypothetical protein [Candidatus Heimdallarchaeota archaeon]
MKVVMANKQLKKWFEDQNEFLSEEIEIIAPENGTDEELIELVSDASIIVATRLSPDVVIAGKKLQLIQKTGAGVDAIPFEVIPERVFVSNTSGANPVPMAEGTIALMFALAKQIVLKHNNFPDRQPLRGMDLRDKHVVIVGMGSIGQEVAKRLVPFGMKIHGIQRSPKEQLIKELALESCSGPETILEKLAIADFVLLTAPLTPATRGMIGEKELKMMKSSGYLVNIGRAALIQEEPLYLALTEGWIAGAALDVWWIPHWWDPSWKPELRVPSRFPIWQLQNVIAIPHNIGFVERTAYSSKSLEIIAENIRRVYDGKPPIHLVDKQHQY